RQPGVLVIEFRSFVSSSAGNCYHVTDGQTELLIEAGLKIADIRKALDFRVSRLAGVLVSHEHMDHSKAAADLAKAGVDVYASEGTLRTRKLVGHRFKAIQAHKQFRVGTWDILPFDVEHDVEEPLGFLLANQDGEKLAFL